jgi:hypothetical protein
MVGRALRFIERLDEELRIEVEQAITTIDRGAPPLQDWWVPSGISHIWSEAHNRVRLPVERRVWGDVGMPTKYGGQ